jgi:hypothetical protein
MSGPNAWGPYGWNFLHYVTLGYPKNPDTDDKKNYKLFFESLKNILPCPKCAKHYEENLKVLPLTDEILDDKEKLIKWLIDVHNRVNVSTGKPEMEYTEARKSIEKPYLYYKNKNNNNNNNNTHYLLIIIILIAVIIYLYYKKKL